MSRESIQAEFRHIIIYKCTNQFRELIEFHISNRETDFLLDQEECYSKQVSRNRICAWETGSGEVWVRIERYWITGHKLFLEAARTLDFFFFFKSCSHLIYNGVFLSNYGWVNLNFWHELEPRFHTFPQRLFIVCSAQCVYLTI